MSDRETVITSEHTEDQRADYRSYVVGFVLSIGLTLGSYLLVTRGIFTGMAALVAIGGLAALQFVVQLLCFLHLGGETKPRWKQLVFWFMILTVFIVVAGSIWIMNNLNYHMMPEHDLRDYLHTNEGI